MMTFDSGKAAHESFAWRETSSLPAFGSALCAFALLFAVPGCGGTEIDWDEEAAVEQQQPDAGEWEDASAQETENDGGLPVAADAGNDPGVADAGSVVPPPADAGEFDAGPAPEPDAGTIDAGPIDPPAPDAGTADAGPITQPDAGTPDAGSECPLRVYVTPDGRDARDGLTQATAVLTLGRV